MWGCGSSRPVPATRREARVPNKHLAWHPCKTSPPPPSPVSAGRALQPAQPATNLPPRICQGSGSLDSAGAPDKGPTKNTSMVVGFLLYSKLRQRITVLVHRKALPSLTVLTRRGLSRSLERHANGQRRSRQFRLYRV